MLFEKLPVEFGKKSEIPEIPEQHKIVQKRRKSESGECFAPICAHVSRRHVHSAISVKSRDPKLRLTTYGAVHVPTAHMNTDGCEALSAHSTNFRAFFENLDLG